MYNWVILQYSKVIYNHNIVNQLNFNKIFKNCVENITYLDIECLVLPATLHLRWAPQLSPSWTVA